MQTTPQPQPPRRNLFASIDDVPLTVYRGRLDHPVITYGKSTWDVDVRC